MQQQQAISNKLNPAKYSVSCNSKKQQFKASNHLYGSETDISTSSENLSVEQRYVLNHSSRIEPQGQENYAENTLNNNIDLYSTERFTSKASVDSVRLQANNRSSSEARNVQQANGNIILNRNSLKEINSNRSSMDVSTCSYNTLIIHNDDSTYLVTNQEYSSPSPVYKKERPRSLGQQGIQEITAIPDDYLNQSHVLKHLAKEMKTPLKIKDNITCGIKILEKNKSQENFDWVIEETELLNKSRSKSQPDLTKAMYSEILDFESLTKENAALKQQLILNCMKVAKAQKLENEVTNIYRAYEELVQSCERREKLERVARLRLQENLQKTQALNRTLRDQIDVLQTQLLAPSEHQILIAQLFTQNKELNSAKERRDIELAAQQATLQEQRTHIGILDTALNNAQRNIRRLEEELRKKQCYVERLSQLNHSVASLDQRQNERKPRFGYETELSKDSNQSCSSTNSDSKWQFHIKRSSSEQKHMSDQTGRQNSTKLSIEKISQETGRAISEAKREKIHYLEDVNLTQRKINDLQAHLEELECLLAEKDTLIHVLQSHKIVSTTYEPYNVPQNKFILNHLHSPPSFEDSTQSFINTAVKTSILENETQNEKLSTTTLNIGNSGPDLNNGFSNCSQNAASSYNENMDHLLLSRNYSPSNNSNFGKNYVSNTDFSTTNCSLFQTSSYDKQYEEHLKKHIDVHLNKFEALQMGLCCLPSLSNKSANEPLISDNVSILSGNNSDTFLQSSIKFDQEKERQSGKNNPEEIVLLEKQGRCSQKIRSNLSGNLAQVTHNVGQNMTDISHIGEILSKESKNKLFSNKGNRDNASLKNKPIRSIKPPRKIDYDRLSDIEFKEYSQKSKVPHKLEIKSSNVKKEFSSRNFCLIGKNYGTINSSEFSKPDISINNKYQRLENNCTVVNKNSDSLKRPILQSNSFRENIKNLRDSVNSNVPNNLTQSPINSRESSGLSQFAFRFHSKTPPKFFQCRSTGENLKNIININNRDKKCVNSSFQQSSNIKSCLPLPPKPIDKKLDRKSSGLNRSEENRYRIQF